MGLWKTGINRSKTGKPRCENMFKLTFGDLCKKITDIDNYNETSYPIIFEIRNGNKIEKYEAGGYTHAAHWEYQYCGKLNEEYDYMDMLYFSEIKDVHISKVQNILNYYCDINDKTEIYINMEKSFKGSQRNFTKVVCNTYDCENNSWDD